MTAQHLWNSRAPIDRTLRVLLVGPYDPHCGEYTFLAPPLGVWRLQGVLAKAGFDARVFDPNCCDEEPEKELEAQLNDGIWDVVGFSTTGMTLRYDLSLAHLVRRLAPRALLVAGGMEATFEPELIYRLAPMDLVVLGEGESPLLALLDRLRSGEQLAGISGTAAPLESGGVQRFHADAMGYAELRDAIELTPYEAMPYESYWRRLEDAYRVQALPFKAEREARLAEIRSVRLITLNYCPMACTFCSSTNFLHSAQGSIAKIARLTADDCLRMIKRIVSAQPRVRSIIFQDDIFVFTNDKRIEALCDGIRHAKAKGEIPPDLEFISTNRIDAMTETRLRAMRAAGFRVLGFGIESFSKSVLEEFNKGQIVRHVEPMLSTALDLRLTPFLDLILSSPRSSLADVIDTVRESYRWIMAGCEVGLYPYVVAFSGSRMAADPELKSQVTTVRRSIPGTDVSWLQPDHIMPLDPAVRSAIAQIVESYELALPTLSRRMDHIPSRARSLLWIACAIPILRATGASLPDPGRLIHNLHESLAGAAARSEIEHGLREAQLCVA